MKKETITTKSGSKIAKKVRQVRRREIVTEEKKEQDYLAKVIKPRPKWIPRGLYIKMLGFFIRIK